MTRSPRILFDVTFTSVEPANVGITRTVRSLWPELESGARARGMEFVPVIFHTGGFRRYVPAEAPRANAAQTPATGWLDRCRLWLTQGPPRRLVSRHFPLALRRIAWYLFSWWEFNRLARHAPRLDITADDVVLSCDASWTYRVWVAARAARRRGARIATVVYDLIPIREPQFCTPLTVIALRGWLKLQLPQSDVALCISRAVEEDLKAYAAEERIRLAATDVLRLGCDPFPANRRGAVRREIREFVSAGPCFACVGSLEPRKNHTMLLDAFEHLWKSGSEARLIVLGRPTEEYKSMVVRLTSLAARESRLMVVTNGTDAELDFVYEQSRALVFPSLAEGFGLPLVEARARGCFAIASDLPVFAELADEGVLIYPRHSAAALADAVTARLAVGAAFKIQPGVPFTWADSARACLTALERHGLLGCGAVK
jgi:glycosyltransferase involved in cell wall biosynthesis